MKRVLAVVLCFWTVGLANQQEKRVRFVLVQPRGQRSSYAIKFEANWKNLDAQDLSINFPLFLTARLETIATSGTPDRNWTLGCTFKSLIVREGDKPGPIWDATRSAGFSLNLDRKGKVIEVVGSYSEDKTTEDVDLLAIHNLLFYLLPTMALPTRSVAPGEFWQIDQVTSAPFETEGERVLDRLRGKGHLKQVAGDLAFMEIEFDRELFLSDSAREPDLLEQGSVNMLLVYDLRHARFVTVHVVSAMKTARIVYSDSENRVQTHIDSILTLQLLPQ